MSLQPETSQVIPAETARIARAAFPKGNLIMHMRDEIGSLFADDQFAALFSSRGQPAETPWRLALVTILQYVEGLSDRQAADAVRSRLDWKYALGLEVTDPGFDSTVLSEFRTRLVVGQAEHLLFDAMLDIFRARQLLRARGRQRTDSTHVLAAVRARNRLETVGETMRYALNSLAVVAPDWLRAHSREEWVARYGHRIEDYRLPTSEGARQTWAEAVGADGAALLSALAAADAPGWLRAVPAVQVLEQVWSQQYDRVDGRLAWRPNAQLSPSAQVINAPYDPEARLGSKGSTHWVGYKVYLTEACDADLPRLITNVDTSVATTADGTMTPQIHQALADKALLPGVHVVDTGFLDAELLVTSRRDHEVELFGPMRADYHRQAREGLGFAASDFRIDWEAKQAICPQGQRSVSWTPAIDNRTNEVIKLKFAPADCQQCPSRVRCTTTVYARRTLTIRPQEQYLALQAARERQTTATFSQQYAVRAGIEGTISRGLRVAGLRHCRYWGLAKTRLQHLITGAALNYLRVGEWLMDTPGVTTRRSAFTKLMAPTA